MSNMLDYLRWRGDLPMALVPVGEVDGLILAQLSMLFWENGLPEGGEATLGALWPAMKEKQIAAGFTEADDRRLLEAVGTCARYADVRLSDYVHLFDADAEMQFAAVTLRLPDGTAYVSFRGTDATIVGWKEDCNMAFSKPVPAQEAAAEYLRAAAARCDGPIRVGGHSKGGNLAMYAAATVEDAVRDHVVAVYNNDGPGLSDRIDAKALYDRIGDRLHSFVPQSSVVGMLLSHPDRYEVVRSDSVSILQHNPYSWQVEGPGFVRAPGLSRDSARFEAAFRRWLSEVDEAERAVLVDTLFDILGAADARSFGRDFWAHLVRNPRAVLSAIQNVDPDARRRIMKMLASLAAAAREGRG